MTDVKFFALGGLDENGKNCYVLDINDDLFVINFGTKVPIVSTYGIDTLIPDYSYLKNNAKRIKGIFIVDTKNDSLSGLPWLLMEIPNVPIFCSSFSRLPILDRLSKYNIDLKSTHVEVIPENGIKVNNTIINAVPLAGALPGTIGFAFNVKEGTYLFLTNFVDGDLGVYGSTNINKIKEKYPNIIALFLDSGLSNFNGKSSQKITITSELEQVFSETTKDERIIIGAYDQEMATLHQVLDMALKYGRDIVTYGRSYYQLLELLQKRNPDLKLPKILDYKFISKHDNNLVIIVSGTVERLFKRFIRITENNDVYLKFNKSDHFVMIAPPINGQETEASYALDEIARITPKITDISEDKFYQCRPAKQDIIDTVQILKPKYFLPIQGLYRYLSVAVREVVANEYPQSNCIILQNGKIAHFQGNELLSQKARISNVGDIIIDGFGVDDISREVILERETLVRDGVVIVSVLVDKKSKKMYDNIDVKYIGVISPEERDEVDEIVKLHLIDVYEKTYLSDDPKLKNNLTNFQNLVRKVIRKKIYKLTYKEPMVIISLTEV
ncbi:MAG: ribonuclease J [Mycoplasma sp.]|nr:ribonuclease J [Mycoplasma sp.]